MAACAAVFAHVTVQFYHGRRVRSCMDGHSAQGASTSTQPPWALTNKERAEHFPDVRSNFLCIGVALFSKYLELGPLPASVADSPRYDGKKDALTSDSKAKLGADSAKKRNRWRKLGHLLGTSNINYGLLVMDTIARQRSHIACLLEPLALHTDAAEARPLVLGDEVLSIQQLEQIRLFHLSLMWLLLGNPALVDPASARFRTFCESLALNLLIVPLSAELPTSSVQTPHVNLETGHVLYNSEERTFIDFRMLDCFLSTHSAAPYHPLFHRPGAIVRTSYSSAIYTLIDRRPGEGLNTQIALSSAREIKPSSQTANHSEQSSSPHASSSSSPTSLALQHGHPLGQPDPSIANIDDDAPIHTTVGEYLRQRWELDPKETDSLLLANPVVFKINIAQDAFPTAAKWVLPVCYGDLGADLPHPLPLPASTDKVGRKLHPSFVRVLPVSLSDLNRACFMPAIVCALQRRLSALHLHFDICWYHNVKNKEDAPTPGAGEADSGAFSSYAIADFGSVSSLSNLQKRDSMRSYKLGELPPPHLIATMEEALTLPSASDSFNYERLETLGDTVLKFLISTSVFITMPNATEGAMSDAKIRLISNKFLAKATHTDWIESRCFQNQLGMDLRKARPRQPLHMKARADLVEAVLGHFFVNHGIDGARVFLSWLDDDFFDLSRKVEDIKRDGDLAHYTRAPLGWYSPPSSRNSSSQSSPQSQRSFTSEGLGGLVDNIVGAYASIPSSIALNELFLDESFGTLHSLGYRFRHKHLLATALTHTSAKPRPTGQTFERFEFLGDACLDLIFLSIMYYRKKLTPGEMSVHRSQIAGNCNYAFLAVCLGFHTLLIYDSVEIYREIVLYTTGLKNLLASPTDELSTLIGNPEVLRLHFPAALSDLFEAIAGAVFIDLDFDLIAFAKVWHPACIPVVTAHFEKNLHARETPHPRFELSHLMLQKHCKQLQTIRENGLLRAVWHGMVLAEVPDTNSRLDGAQLDEATLKILRERHWLWQEHCDCTQNAASAL